MAKKSMKKITAVASRRSSDTGLPAKAVPKKAARKHVVPDDIYMRLPAPAPATPLSPRLVTLQKMLLERREALMREIQDQLGHTLTEEPQRRFESAMDSGDQAVLDLDREMDISLQEKRNRERQMIDEALASMEEGTYGLCIECGADISEKRLAVMPFARLCLACQERTELFEKIERGEQRN